MRPLLLVGIFGAALLFGDGMITPAITVLGAVEGLKVATPMFEPFIVPISITILVLLFGRSILALLASVRCSVR